MAAVPLLAAPPPFGSMAAEAELAAATAHAQTLLWSHGPYLDWLYRYLKTVSLVTQHLQIPPILPPPGTWSTPVQIFDRYFRLAVARWLPANMTNEYAPIAVAEWVATARPILKTMLRAGDKDYWSAEGMDVTHTIGKLISELEDDVDLTANREMEKVLVEVLVASAEAAREDNKRINWRKIRRHLPELFRDLGPQNSPLLFSTIDALEFTPEEREARRVLAEQSAALELKLAGLPDVPAFEEAQILLGALRTQAASTNAEDAYANLLEDVFSRAEIETQGQIVPLLPTMEDFALMTKVSTFGEDELRSSLMHDYTRMIVGLIADDERPGTVADKVTAVIANGGDLLRHMVLVVGDVNPELGLPSILRRLIWRIATLVEQLGEFDPALDELFHWIITKTLNWASERGQYFGLNLHAVLLGIHKTLVEEVGDDYSTAFPFTYSILRGVVEEEARLQSARELERATQAFRGRLASRRRLSIPLYFQTAPTEEKKEETGLVPLHGPAPVPSRRRRVSVRPAVTLSSNLPEIRSWLQQQIAQEEAYVAGLGGAIPPQARKRARSRARAPASAAAPQAALPPLLRNCEVFATQRCSQPTNIAGQHFCNVPRSYWWGPLGVGRNCYDIRELLEHFGRQVISIPGIRPGHDPSYPDTRVPVTPAHLRTMLEIARANNFPVPWQLQIYMVGQEVQRPSAAAALFRSTGPRDRMQRAEPFAAVSRALEQQEKVTQAEIQATYGHAPEPEAGDEEEPE